MLGLSVQSDDATAEPDRLSARQANPPDPRHLRTSHRSGCGPGGAASWKPHRRSTSWRRAARRCGSRASTSTGWIRSPVRRTPRALTAAEAAGISGDAAVRGAGGGEWRPSGPQRCGSRRSWRASAASLTAWRSRSSWRRGASSPYGLQQTAALLDQRLTLLWPGPRTAPPRQQTLQAIARLELRAPVRAGTRGASPARGIRRTFYARCGAGRRDERQPSIDRRFLARSTAWSPSRCWPPGRSAP